MVLTKEPLWLKVKYRIRGIFGGDFNLAVWRITSESPNLSHAILKAIF